jgi:hypothetical protein
METAESLAASLDLNSIDWRTVTVIPITLEEKNRFQPARRYHNLSGALVIIRDEGNSNPPRNTQANFKPPFSKPWCEHGVTLG